ncbi:MAG: methicillin resistance protein [bacterium P3]|nr:MAG: methicillin resistance protein [bacterium P3]KWW42373.1 MAG: methicillin resistance protein [bacterium F083]
MTAKEEYRALCEDPALYVPLFQQHWWMEAVCAGKHWDVLLSRDKSGAVQAALPYLSGRKMGLRYIIQPQLTQYNGIWYRYPKDGLTDSQRLTFEKQAADSIIRQLKALRIAYYQQNFAPSITNWLPFYWAGYRQTTRYTYRLPDIRDTDALFRRFNKNERQRRIGQLLPRSVLTTLSADEFADYQQLCRTLSAQHNLLPHDLVVRTCEAALNRKQGVCFALDSDDGERMAALFVPYDRQCAYYLIPALNPQFRDKGAMETLIWMAVRQLSTETRSFDFEGSMEPGIEQFYRSFGAEQIPFFRLSRCIVPCLT